MDFSFSVGYAHLTNVMHLPILSPHSRPVQTLLSSQRQFLENGADLAAAYCPRMRKVR